MDWKSKWNEWQSAEHTHDYIIEDLKNLTEDEAKEQFKQHLAFGTGGARGTFGAGINRINHYTIRRITQGFLNYLEKNLVDSKDKGIAISYDTRHFSKEFAENVAYLAAENGFNVYLSDEARPTPLLSYMVRKYNTAGGVMITASHNPPNYNGYKIYDHTGGQMTEKMADGIVNELSDVNNELQLGYGEIAPFISENNITIVGDDLDQSYLSDLENSLREPELFKKSTDFNVVYTPLHGAGLGIIKKALDSLQFKNYSLVREQMTVDGRFETVRSPNPEDRDAFEYAETLGKKEQANLIMATDPDADRLGVAVYENGEYIYLNGNQLGAILLAYLTENSKGQDLTKSVLIKTIVTSELGAEISKANGIEVMNTLTGFKYIGEKITQMEEIGEKEFLFGYEESYGYLFNSIVRDKDAVQAVLLLLEAALYYHQNGQSLIDVLDGIHERFGFYTEELVTVKIESDEQVEALENNIEQLKYKVNEPFGNFKLASIEDYDQSKRSTVDGKTNQIDLPQSNVLKLIFDDRSWLAIRPSGTEPKYKFYFSVVDESVEKSQKKMTDLKSAFFNRLDL